MRKFSWVVVGVSACGEPEAPGPCGGDPALIVGHEDGAFIPYEDGDAVPVEVDGDGVYRFVVDSRISGLDPSAPLSAVVRLRFGDDASQDFLASVALFCTDEPGSYTFITPLDAAYQDADVIAALDGTSFTLDAVFTDGAGTIAEANHTLVISAP